MWGWTRTSGVITFEARFDARAVLCLIRGERGCLQIGAGSVGAGLGQPWVLVAAHVVPGPAVEAAFFDGCDVVGHEMIAQVVAFIGGAPKLAGGGIDGLADTVADAVRVDLDELAFRRVFENIGAVKLAGMGVGVVDI